MISGSKSRTAKEVLIKSGMQITQTDFSPGGCRPQDCMKMTQEYLMYFKEFSCNKTENMQVRCVLRFIQRFPKYKKERYREVPFFFGFFRQHFFIGITPYLIISLCIRLLPRTFFVQPAFLFPILSFGFAGAVPAFLHKPHDAEHKLCV